MRRYALPALLAGALLLLSSSCSGSRVSAPPAGGTSPPAPRSAPGGPASAGGAEKSSLIEKSIGPSSELPRDGSNESSYIYVPTGGER